MEAGRSALKAWPLLGITAMQVLLLLAHWFLFRTWMVFWPEMPPLTASILRDALILLGPSFIAAALLGFYYSNGAVRLLYNLAATWMGFLNYFFWAACLCRLLSLALRLTPWGADLGRIRPLLAAACFSLAVLISFYGLVNARLIRLRRVRVELPNLPAAWRGRTALLLSDLHLGNILTESFAARLARLAAKLQPDIVFIPGDLFDGAKADPDRLLAPFKAMQPPCGVYFAAGNHDEFGGEEHFSAPLGRIGFHVLHNERVVVEGLQIVGVTYGESTHPLRMRQFLESLKLREGGAAILLNHVPNRLPVVEGCGVSLQLSGHTHGGQFFPFTWMTRRVFGRFTSGMQRFGALQVYTSTGCGSWGPPMRVGSAPEIVLLTFA
jgi:hypothetical protein